MPEATQWLCVLSKLWQHFFVPVHQSWAVCLQKQVTLLLSLEALYLISNQGSIQAWVTKPKHHKIWDLTVSTKISAVLQEGQLIYVNGSESCLWWSGGAAGRAHNAECPASPQANSSYIPREQPGIYNWSELEFKYERSFQENSHLCLSAVLLPQNLQISLPCSRQQTFLTWKSKEKTHTMRSLCNVQ